MCFKKNRLIGYSERGVMNALFYSIANDKAKMEQFLQLANSNFSLQNDYKVYMEPSFSKYFGDPDAVIVDSEKVFFIEAKVCAQKKWTFKKEINEFDRYVKGGKNNSGLLKQVYLKTLVVKAAANGDNPKEIYNPITKKNCRLGKHLIVDSLFNQIKGKIPHYIGIIPTTEHKQFETIDFENNNTPTEIFFILWKQVEEKFSHSYQLLFDAFEHNKGQIYNE